MFAGIGIGIDIIEIQRINDAISKFGDKFLNKIFTENEINYCKAKAKPAQHFAARFAAKEAIIKSLGKEISLSFTDIEIINEFSGKPNAIIKGKSLVFEISISHSHNYAVACVVHLKE